MDNVYENRNVISELKEKLIDYLTTFDPTLRDLDNFGYDELLQKYGNLFCMARNYNEFNSIIESNVNEIKESDPDLGLTDIEIIYSYDLLNPMNFMGLLTTKTLKIKKELDELEKEREFFEDNKDIFYSSKGDYESLVAENARKTSICLNYIKKCNRIMQTIEEEYCQGRHR